MATQECVICLDEVTRQSVSNLFKYLQNARNNNTRILQLCMSNCGCNGYIHSKCLVAWVEQNSENRHKCPICRTIGENYTLDECFPQPRSKDSSHTSSPISISSVVNEESPYQAMSHSQPQFAPPPTVVVHSASRPNPNPNPALAPMLPIAQQNHVILIRFFAILIGIVVLFLIIGSISNKND
jgi:hypothetical protein